MAVFPSASNTYVLSHEASGSMVIDFSRNIDDFPINQYAQLRKVNKMSGYYLEMTVEEAGRILNADLQDFEWPDSTPDPDANDGTESFNYLDFHCKRYRYGFAIGDLASEQASWDIIAQHSSIKARQAMTARTQLAISALTDASAYATSHKSAVGSIPGVTDSWELSTTSRTDIKRSLDYAAEIINIDTLGVVQKKDLILVISPTLARKMSVAQEIVDYMKGSPQAYPFIRGSLPGGKVEYELPSDLYGYKLVVENSVKTTSHKGASSVSKSYIMPETTPVLISRVGALEAKIPASAPSFSTLTGFMYEEMTVETRNEPDNRRTKGRVVENMTFVVTAPVSAFRFSAATTT